jgi:DNA-binding NarL/FixJ family response regulator
VWTFAGSSGDPADVRSTHRAERELLDAVDDLVAGVVRATAAQVRRELAAALTRVSAEPSGLHGLGPDRARLRAVLDATIAERRLSAREAQVLIAAANGTPRDRLAEVLGVSENTVKTQIRRLLGKLGMGRTLDDAVWAMHSRAK